MGLLFHRSLGVTPRIGIAPGGGGYARCGTVRTTQSDAIAPGAAAMCVTRALSRKTEGDRGAHRTAPSLPRASTSVQAPRVI